MTLLRAHIRKTPVTFLALVLSGLALLVGLQHAAAQNQPATPVAAGTPVASACSGPEAVAQPTVPDRADDASNGTPSPAAELPPVDAETAARIMATVDSLAACLTDGNTQAVASLVTERYLGDAYGAGERMTKEDYLALSQSAPIVGVRVVSVDYLTFAGPESAVGTVTTIQGNQLREERWTFLFRRDRLPIGTPTAPGAPLVGRWLVHGLEPLDVTPPANASELDATLDEYTIDLSASSVDGPELTIEATNSGVETHELLVLRLGSGATIASLLRPTDDGFPVGIDVVGQVTVPVGQTRNLVLVDLPAGTYTIVCLLPDGTGVPHLSLGQQATFTVR